MISFSSGEIFLSILYAFIFGVIYSVIYQIIFIIIGMIKSFPLILKEILEAKTIHTSPTVKKYIRNISEGKTLYVLSIFFFFVGFLFLSYYSLDGQIRLYMLSLSSASFYLSNSLFAPFLRSLLTSLINIFIFLLSTIIKLLLFPLKEFFKRRKSREIS